MLFTLASNVRRVLKRGGFSIFFDTHPMSRPFDSTTYELRIKKPYEDTGPFGDDVPEYGWRTQDIVNAVVSSGLTLREMREFHSVREDLHSHNYLYINKRYEGEYEWTGDAFDWKVNPWAALPQCLCLCSEKTAR